MPVQPKRLSKVLLTPARLTSAIVSYHLPSLKFPQVYKMTEYLTMDCTSFNWEHFASNYMIPKRKATETGVVLDMWFTTISTRRPRGAPFPRVLRGFCPINPRGFHACPPCLKRNTLPLGPRGGGSRTQIKHEVT